MPPNPTLPYSIRRTPAPSVTVAEPPLDLEASEPDESAGVSRWSSHRSILAFLGVFFVATVCANLWADEGHVASSTEATGIDAEGVVASLVAERREHAALADLRREQESAVTGSPGSATAQPASPGGDANSTEQSDDVESSNQQQQQQQQQPAGGRDPDPGSGNLTLPVVGETPLAEPQVPEVPLLDSAELPEVPVDSGTLLP